MKFSVTTLTCLLTLELASEEMKRHQVVKLEVSLTLKYEIFCVSVWKYIVTAVQCLFVCVHISHFYFLFVSNYFIL